MVSNVVFLVDSVDCLPDEGSGDMRAPNGDVLMGPQNQDQASASLQVNKFLIFKIHIFSLSIANLAFCHI